MVERSSFGAGGGGGGGGVRTVTVADAVTVPPSPLTSIWYSVVAVGNTSREPVVGTVPIPWLSEALAALDEVHLSVADLPRSIEVGSAVRVTVGRGLGCSRTGGGGGGGGSGAGVFFLQPAAKSAKLALSTISATLRLLCMELVGLLTFTAIH